MQGPFRLKDRDTVLVEAADGRWMTAGWEMAVLWTAEHVMVNDNSGPSSPPPTAVPSPKRRLAALRLSRLICNSSPTFAASISAAPRTRPTIPSSHGPQRTPPAMSADPASTNRTGQERWGRSAPPPENQYRAAANNDNLGGGFFHSRGWKAVIGGWWILAFGYVVVLFRRGCSSSTSWRMMVWRK
ncbi:uncharacterized protein BKA78DRAFT_144797 [Phyllosticta capitalensis]|uniref:uncharacterized protein n=1 Tax=Phyllosticta capitalensis TaxID=121624 RepID=UPI00312D4027